MGLVFNEHVSVSNKRRSMRFETNPPKPRGMLVVNQFNYEVEIQDYSLEGLLLLVNYNDFLDSKVADLYLENEKFLVRICHQRLNENGLVMMGLEKLSCVPCNLDYEKILDAQGNKGQSRYLILMLLIFVVISSVLVYLNFNLILVDFNHDAKAQANHVAAKVNESEIKDSVLPANSLETHQQKDLTTNQVAQSQETFINEVQVKSLEDYKTKTATHVQNYGTDDSKHPLVALELDLKDIDSITDFVSSIAKKEKFKHLILKFVVSNKSVDSPAVDNYYKQLMVKLDNKYFLVSLESLRNLKIAMRDDQSSWTKFLKSINHDLQAGRLQSQLHNKSGKIIYILN